MLGEMRNKRDELLRRALIALMRMRASSIVCTLIVMANLESVDATATNATCDFPYSSTKPEMDLMRCSVIRNKTAKCITFLLGQASQPPDGCCPGVWDSWNVDKACLCGLTFYPPFVNITLVQQILPIYCNMSTDLCGQCPKLLAVLAKKKPLSTLGVVAIIVGCLIAIVALAISLLLWRKRLRSRSLLPQLYADRDEILKIEGRPTLFAYNVLKAATKSFHISSKLGEGGFGVVYKGVLQDGSEVAVKQLSTKSRQGNEEFLNEVTLITGVQHRNLVKLRGCCLKGHERLLVYEYLENRSLYQALFATGERLHLDWPTRVKILVGTARGLQYLHEGCQARIVHRDIKSSNILLDKDLNPKIADFGLARLFTDDQSHVSTRVAGTAGYLAPEYAMRGQLTEKADVFSFGIVAFELVSGRSNFNARLPAEEAYLLDWTWNLHEEGNLLALLDPLLKEKPYPEDEVIRVIEIALLCTQSMASMRPSMSRVVSMLAGDSEVETSKVTKPSLHMFSSDHSSSNEPGYYLMGHSHSSCPRTTSSIRVNTNISIVNPR